MIALTIISFCICFSLGVILGAKVYKAMVENNIKKENEKLIDNINNQFSQILKNITTGLSKFKSRINSTVHIETNLGEHGNIDIIYLLDKNDIAIFQGPKCLYTSDKVDKEIVSNITKTIDILYKKEISEVINFFGLVLSKDEFEKQFKIDVDDVQNLVKKLSTDNIDSEISEIDKIVGENQTKFDVDEILDKISKYGIEFLTTEEKQFLDNLGNEKRD
jgi:hypothetical protein